MIDLSPLGIIKNYFALNTFRNYEFFLRTFRNIQMRGRLLPREIIFILHFILIQNYHTTIQIFDAERLKLFRGSINFNRKLFQHIQLVNCRSLQLQMSLIPFAIGGISGAIATLVIQPLDTLKVQVQIVSEQLGKIKSDSLTLSNIIRKIRQQQGLKVLYRGLDSAILRQIFYASARLGAYEVFVSKFEKANGKKTTKLEKTYISLGSGVFGALVGNPFDVALIRRQASIADQKNNYRNTLQAFTKIIKYQGILSLWSGINITITRVALINFAQLAGRDFISQWLQPLQLKEHNNIVALTASALTAVISLPADNIKVKLQKQSQTEKVYKGIWDCLSKSVRREGVLRLWVGFPIYLVRGAPHSFILIRTQMYLSQKWRKYQKQS